MKPFHKSSTPQLDMETAGRILEQAFKAAGEQPNSIPLDELIANCLYHRKKRIFQKAVFAIVIAFLFLVGFLFAISIPASFTVQNQMAEGEFNPVYNIIIDSFMPVKRVNAVLNGRPVPLYETDSHIYVAEPSSNGQMEISVTLINGRNAIKYVDVAGVDRISPSAVGCRQEGSLIYLYLSDEFSGIDYDSLQAVALTGEAVTPVSVEPQNGCVTFSNLKETINVYVSDLAGNKLQLILSLTEPQPPEEGGKTP